mmetsp:Transcript_55627/g.146779  ORF Transcript_55627/g.146779 Transcript_55627/m.146779 type:complete len:219 (+) Transcript_55627:532-1188(+)
MAIGLRGALPIWIIMVSMSNVATAPTHCFGATIPLKTPRNRTIHQNSLLIHPHNNKVLQQTMINLEVVEGVLVTRRKGRVQPPIHQRRTCPALVPLRVGSEAVRLRTIRPSEVLPVGGVVWCRRCATTLCPPCAQWTTAWTILSSKCTIAWAPAAFNKAAAGLLYAAAAAAATWGCIRPCAGTELLRIPLVLVAATWAAVVWVLVEWEAVAWEGAEWG